MHKLKQELSNYLNLSYTEGALFLDLLIACQHSLKMVNTRSLHVRTLATSNIPQGRSGAHHVMIRFGLVNIFAAANGPVNGSVNFLERYLPIHKILLFAGAIVPVFTEANSFAAANVPVKMFCLGNITGTILTQITRHNVLSVHVLLFNQPCRYQDQRWTDCC